MPDELKDQAVMKIFKEQSKNEKTAYFVIYTLIFAIMSVLIFSYFYLNGKSFIWNRGGGDGLTQHYASLAYFGGYLRQIISNLIHTGRLVIPQWNFNIGLGSDIPTVLQFYVFGDPLALLSIFFKPAHTELLYDLLIVLRFYLAGIAFSILCFNRGLRRYPVLVASFVYVFCGFAVYAGVRHPMFLNPMIYLPLLLYGINRIFAGKKPYPFILAVGVSAASNFYFFYMLTILTIIYAVFRFFEVFKTDRPRNFLKMFLKCALAYAGGVCLAAAILLPTILAFINNGRLDSPYSANMLAYEHDYYTYFLGDFIAVPRGAGWTQTGYAPIALVCIVTLFFQGFKRNKELAINFALLTVFLLIPFFGYAFNGFSYVTNRWVFGYSLLIALITATVLPEIMRLEKRTMIALVTVVIIYGALAIGSDQKQYTIVGLTCLSLTSIVVLGINLMPKAFKDINRYKSQRIGSVVILLVTLVSINALAGYRYSPKGMNYIDETVKSGEANHLYKAKPAALVSKIEDNSFYRTEEVDAFSNDSMYLKFNGAAEFFSMIDADITTSLSDQGLAGLDPKYFQGLNSRAYLGTLDSVKYFATMSDQTSYVPYGYSLLMTDKRGRSIYKNNNYLPLGYTYGSYITTKEFKSLPLEKRQEALLQNIVLENGISGFTEGSPTFTDENIDYTMKVSKGISINNGHIKVYKKDSSITFAFNGRPDSETYLALHNLDYSSKNSTQMKLVIGSAGREAINLYQNKQNSWPSVQHDFLFNLGYSPKGQTYCTVTFKNRGAYRLDDIKIVCQPMTDFSAQVDRLKAESLENIVVGTDKVSGTVSLDRGKVLCLSIPYSKGWSAEVDGKPAKILKANGAFMAIPLNAGTHKIALTYRTPGLIAGALVSAFAAFTLLTMFVISKRKDEVASTGPDEDETA